MKELFLKFHKAVKEVERLHREIEQNTDIRICGGYEHSFGDAIHLNDCIEDVAEMLGKKIKYSDGSAGISANLSFEFDDVFYFELANNERAEYERLKEKFGGGEV